MISDSVREALETAVIEGDRLMLPSQLDRADYVAVNKVLENLGGKWNRKAKAHVFPRDPREALAEVLHSGETPRAPRTVEGFVRTPDDVAYDIVYNDTEIGDLEGGLRVLEPSAGDGSLVRAILKANRQAQIVALEPNVERANLILGEAPQVCVEPITLETYAGTFPGLRNYRKPFDAVVMNPPFSVPGNSTIWIDHIEIAWRLLKEGGRLTSIVPAGYRFRDDTKHRRIRNLVEEHVSHTRDLPDDTFGGVRTLVIAIEKTPSGRFERAGTELYQQEHDYLARTGQMSLFR